MHWLDVSGKQFFEHLEHWVTVVPLLVCQWCSCKPLTTDLNHQRLWLFGPRIFTPKIFIPRIFMLRLCTPQIFITRIFRPRLFRPHRFIPRIFTPWLFTQFNFQFYAIFQKKPLIVACLCVLIDCLLDWTVSWFWKAIVAYIGLHQVQLEASLLPHPQNMIPMSTTRITACHF